MKDEAISRQAAIGIVQNWLNSDTGYSWGEKNVMKCTIDELRDLPLVTPQQKVGKWIRATDKAGYLVWECNCGWQQRIATNYCPDCGTKMEGVEE